MRKKLLLLLLVVALVGAVFAGCKAKPDEGESTSVPETSVSQQSTTAAGETTTAAPEETTSEAAEDNVPAFIKEGCWYFYEEEDKMAYAFVFGNGGTVEMAFFNQENVEGDDAKYTEGKAAYTLDGNTLTVSDIPSEIGMKSFVLTVEGDKLLYNGIALDKQDKVSLDYPFAHFNG